MPRARLLQRLHDMGKPWEMIWDIIHPLVDALGLQEASQMRSLARLGEAGLPAHCDIIWLHFIDRFGGSKGTLANTWIPLLLYADDIELILDSADWLQRHLDGFQEFCTQRDLTVNLGKTKVMIFHTSPGLQLHMQMWSRWYCHIMYLSWIGLLQLS